MSTYVCAVSGEESPGKHYVLRTTEGEELLCPEALLGTRAHRDVLRLVADLARRVRELEERLAVAQASEPGPVPEPEKKPAAVKRAARAPRPRKGD